MLVDYSKDLYTCMILDDQLHEEGYSVQEGFIYYHGRIFLSRASKLKNKLLQRAYEEFFFSHTYSMKAYNVGNVFIDGKGDGIGGTPETATKQRSRRGSKETDKKKR